MHSPRPTTRTNRHVLLARLLLLLLGTALAFLPSPPVAFGRDGLPAALRAERRNPAPTPSGAGAAYPLNHTFDAESVAAGSPAANADFEAPAAAVGTPAANSTFSAPPADAGPTLPNYNFESGDLTGWTPAGTVTVQTDAAHGKYAKLTGWGSTLTSSAFTVDGAAQAFTFDLGYLSTTDYGGVKVYALSGPSYATQTLLNTYYCRACGSWTSPTISAAPYRGQSIKLKFEYYLGDPGIDAVRVQTLFAGWEVSGTFTRETEGDGNVFLALRGGTSPAAISPAVTLDATAQSLAFRLKGLTPSADQYQVYLLSGADFATSTLVKNTSYARSDDTWETVHVNVSPWAGQQVKLKVVLMVNSIGIDDAGVPWVDVPQWGITQDTTLVSGGPTGAYARTNGNLVSAPITLGGGVQQLSLSYRGDGTSPLFYVELLRGADFSQVVDIGGGVITADLAQWKTLRAGVQQYAGETVKLRIRQYMGWGLYDNAGLGEVVVPGWTLTTVDGVAAGQDANGTYVTPSRTALSLRSSDVTLGVVDRPNAVDARYYAVS